MKLKFFLCAIFAITISTACTSQDDSSRNTIMSGGNEAEGTDEPSMNTESSRYSFTSRSGDESSVSYSGQIVRHALIQSLKGYISQLTEQLQRELIVEAGTVQSIMELYFDCPDGLCAEESIAVNTPLPAIQSTIGDLSSPKSLVEKIAGNDPVGQHKDWMTEFKGWGEEVISPESLVRQWFTAIDERVVAISNGDYEIDPNGDQISVPFVSAEGLDYAQLIQKFLLGSIAFSQAADDYLDDSEADKGLNSDHSELVEGKSYTALEHSWDEGFGYFGAAQAYLESTDEEIASKGGRPEYQGAIDSNADGQIDLKTEYHWGHSLNAAKRDLEFNIDLTTEVYDAFYEGRALIASVEGPLDRTQIESLKTLRDQAISGWERVIAATVIHYINDVLTELTMPESINFLNHAKHWSEMKGFALSFQFNPRSALSEEDFIQLHTFMGTKPVWPNSNQVNEYKNALEEARTLLADRFNLDKTPMAE